MTDDITVFSFSKNQFQNKLNNTQKLKIL